MNTHSRERTTKEYGSMGGAKPPLLRMTYIDGNKNDDETEREIHDNVLVLTGRVRV